LRDSSVNGALGSSAPVLDELVVASVPLLLPLEVPMLVSPMLVSPLLPVGVPELVSPVLPVDVEPSVWPPSDDILAGEPPPQATHTPTTAHTKWGAHADGFRVRMAHCAPTWQAGDLDPAQAACVQRSLAGPHLASGSQPRSSPLAARRSAHSSCARPRDLGCRSSSSWS
jgi:hypothetical protein